MRPNLAQIFAFVAIAKAGRFTGAARTIHASQRALIVQIRQLGQLFGLRLIERNTRSIAAENGATTEQLKATFGWLHSAEADPYTRQAEQKRLAASAMHLLMR
jgi:hypothetical protein